MDEIAKLTQQRTDLLNICQELADALAEHVKQDAKRAGVSEESYCPCKTGTLAKAREIIKNVTKE